jgi:hypothetical protein
MNGQEFALTGQTNSTGSLAVSTANGLDGSAGVVGANAYSTMCANSAAIVAGANATQLAWQTASQVFLQGLGIVKQYEAIEKQGNLADAQRDVALRQITLTEKNFNDLILPAYKQADEYFYKYFRKQWEPKLAKIADCGLQDCEYTPDFNRWVGRGIADAVKVINGAKRANKRALDCYSAGACCDQEYRMAELQARLTVEVVNMGRMHEEEIKAKKDAFYWNRFVNVAQMVNNIGSLAANLQHSGKQSLSQGLNSIQAAVSGFDAAVGSGFSALSQAGSFYGGLGGLAGRISGQQAGEGVAQAILGNQQNALYNPANASATDFRAGYYAVNGGTLPTNNSGVTFGNPGYVTYSERIPEPPTITGGA